MFSNQCSNSSLPHHLLYDIEVIGYIPFLGQCLCFLAYSLSFLRTERRYSKQGCSELVELVTCKYVTASY